jgi:hypothetical protein
VSDSLLVQFKWRDHIGSRQDYEASMLAWSYLYGEREGIVSWWRSQGVQLPAYGQPHGILEVGGVVTQNGTTYYILSLPELRAGLA